ncbi:MAG: hypothetical protein IJ386_00235 [Clostridia bacterium]|nr:hypothetical protein [Clostridia bacterium]
MNFKKIMCALLCGAMLTASFAACANNEDDENPKESVAITNEDGNTEHVFKEESYDGDEFKFLHYGNTATDFHDAYIWADSVTGGAIGDAVADRNRIVDERYDVVIAAEECGPMGEAVKRMQAGQCDFEMIYEWGSRSVTSALDGMLYDFRELEGIDFEQSWWVPSAAESLTIADRMFITTNMISMNSISWAGIVYFNKALMDKLNFDYPYDNVETNTWTCDVMLEMMNEAEEDVNGDGIMNLEDQYGALGTSLGSILYAEPLAELNEDGSYTVIGYTEKMVATYNEYSRKLESASTRGLGDFWDEVDHSVAASPHIAVRATVFGEDHALFMSGSIDMTKELLNMAHDYGVVPNPKAEPEDEWSADMDYNAPMFTIPVQVADPDMAATVMDYMAYESERILLPAYYETTIKTKRMQDTRDYEMLDIVRSSVVYDPVSLYIGGIEDNGFDFRGAMLSSGNFASVWARYSKKAQASLDTLITKLEEIGY